MSKIQSKNFFFYHDKNARNDMKLKYLISKYGIQAYAWYFMLLEILSDSESYELDLNDKIKISLVSMELQLTKELFFDFIDSCIEVDLLKKENAILFSKRLKEHMYAVDEETRKRKESMAKVWSEKKKAKEQNERIQEKAKKGSSSAKFENRFINSDDITKPEQKNYGYDNLPDKKQIDRNLASYDELKDIDDNKNFSLDIGSYFDFNDPSFLGDTKNPEIIEGKFYSGTAIKGFVPYSDRIYWTRENWKNKIINKKFFGKVSDKELWQIKDDAVKKPHPDRFFSEKLYNIDLIIRSCLDLEVDFNPFSYTRKSEKQALLSLYLIAWKFDWEYNPDTLIEHVNSVKSTQKNPDFILNSLLKRILLEIKNTNYPSKEIKNKKEQILEYFKSLL